MAHGGDIYRNRVEMDFSVNLNPLPIHEAVRQAMQESLLHTDVYPDREQDALRDTLANCFGVGKGCVFAGNGASELIMASARAFMPKRVLLIEPCYSGYRYAIESIPGCRIGEYLLPKRNGFTLTDAVLHHISSDMDMIFLTDPWNPTGKNLDDGFLRRILQKASEQNAVVVLDQSFLLLSEKGIAGCTVSGLLKSFLNLVVIRSFTKFLGVPGIRMGAVISSADNIGRIRRNLPEWNVSVQAEAVMQAGIILAEDKAYVGEVLSQLRTGRAYLTAELSSLGCRVFDSDAAFLLFHSEKGWYESLLEKGILIRDCRDYPGLGKGYYRIAVKDDASNRKLVECMKRV